MPTDHRTELAGIKRFDQLIRYLRDRMGWPIDGGDFEELTFEYTPEELGIDAKNAAKIQEIKRLRPLSARQPWGIFFVKFEPKKLPVVALRRILSQVALKKRASANSAERAAWAADDLLFVSNYGEGDERQISFAHFSKAADGHDLPTLKVLGWDNLDTALHLDAVAKELTEHLAWPDDDTDMEAWRKRWRAAFTLRHGEVVTTSKELSIRLAELARMIRDRVKTALAIETETGALTRLMKAFQEALVHDLDSNGFADMYAQTIAYGLLSARIADPHKKTADDFTGHMRTNPFLRELMETFLKVGGRRGKAGGPGIDFDELGVSEVVELLDDANMEAVVRDFGDRNPQEDPVIHFYELFLKEYDAKKRMQRGVFYTPRPVVSYIVRSVDELLRTEFGLADGLADATTWGEMAKRHKDLTIPDDVEPGQPFVQILDPATGTGTFLVEVIDLIHKTLVAKWKVQGHGERRIEALWNDYVPKHLLPRLHGYELMMSPYAIAHLKIGLKLYETGYRFDSDERARIYLTNALEPARDMQLRTSMFPALAHEALAVNEVKRKQRFTVVIGNPPYAGESSNDGVWVRGLLRSYYMVDGRPLGEQNPRWLQDDYVKFIRLAEYLVTQTSVGVVGYITNHSYIDNPTFRGLRRSVQLTFNQSISVLDLHGNTKKGERDSKGLPDKNVFDIQQGVAVSLFARVPTPRYQEVRYADILGSRESKYAFLVQHVGSRMPWSVLTPVAPFYLFTRQDRTYVDEYEQWPRITDVMPLHSNGVVTGRDHLCVQWSREQAWNVVRRFVSLSREEARKEYGLGPDSRDWQVSLAQADLKRDGPRAGGLASILYRPFDTRWTYYTGRSRGFLCMPRRETMQHMLTGDNLALITSRMTKGETFRHAQVARTPSEAIVMSPKTSNNGFIFPLFIHENADNEGVLALGSASGKVNLAGGFRELVSRGTTPEDVFRFIYAVLHSPSYRTRYVEFLKTDFPRLPLSGSLDLFRDVARLGGDLVALHLTISPKLDHFITTFTGPKSPRVERVGWSDDTVWLDAAATKKGQRATPGTIGFRGVSEAVWKFHIGGYQVCEKWLKDRKGRTLSKDDIAHYQKIVVGLTETIRLMKEIDEVIEKHGGWPGAFRAAGDVEKPSEQILKVAEPPGEYGPRGNKDGR
jgi:predicted helicase